MWELEIFVGVFHGVNDMVFSFCGFILRVLLYSYAVDIEKLFCACIYISFSCLGSKKERPDERIQSKPNDHLKKEWREKTAKTL